MKYLFAFIIAWLVVLTASRRRQVQESASSSLENDIESFETLDLDDEPVLLDLKGTLNRFLSLYAALEDPNRNVICSPISALLPLGKLVLGTEKGKSQDELLSALGYPKNIVKKRLRSMIEKLKYLPGVALTIASALYISKNKKLTDKYNSDTMSVFKTTVQKLDFSKPTEAADVINMKVLENTQGKIADIISPSDITRTTSLLLVNAVYFVGNWENPFKSVRVGDFYSPVGVKKIFMMSHHGDYNYAKSDALGVQIIEIPYQGNNASFIIVLPKTQYDMLSLINQLKIAPDLLNKALSSMTEYIVSLTIPKFRIESELNLKTLYEKIGVKKIFKSDQSGLTRVIQGQDKLWVSKAVQKVYIEVSEKGTEAAAATSITMVGMSMSTNQVVFKANRPFLFFIKAGTEQLFAGVYTGV